MMLGNMVKSTENATLQKREERFGGVRVNAVAKILFCAVIHRSMTADEMLSDAVIGGPFIGQNHGIGMDVFPNGRVQVFGRDAINNARLDVTVPLDKRHDWRLVLRTATAPTAAQLAADVSLINFNRAFKHFGQ